MISDLDLERMKNFLESVSGKKIELSDMETKRFNSLSNTIVRFSHGDLAFIYRGYGSIDELVRRDVENRINESLSSAGFTGKYIKSFDGYRIEEYLPNTQNLTPSKRFDRTCLDWLTEVTRHFCKVYDLYRLDGIYDVVNVTNKFDYKPPETSFKFMVKDMLQVGLENFYRFKAENTNSAYNDSLDKFEKVLLSFEDKLKSLKIEENCLFTVAHNDNHSLNILESKVDDKLFIVDYEYGSLSPLGADIANYLVETCYIHDVPEFPYYTYDFKLFDFEKFYKIYLDSVEPILKDFAEHIEDPEYYKSKGYFAKVMNHQNYLWFIYCFVYFDYTKHCEGSTWYFDHANSRLELIDHIASFNYY